MEFYSTRNKSYRLSGEQAVIAGIAPDGGLFFCAGANCRLTN